jgi:hypothetical protein
MSSRAGTPMIPDASKPPTEVEQLDRLLDQCLEETFPASDPISSLRVARSTSDSEIIRDVEANVGIVEAGICLVAFDRKRTSQQP